MTGDSCPGTALQGDGAWPAGCAESSLDQCGILVCLVPSPLHQPPTPQAVGGQKPCGRFWFSTVSREDEISPDPGPQTRPC